MNRMSPLAYSTLKGSTLDITPDNTIIMDMPYLKNDGSFHMERTASGFFCDEDCTDKQLVQLGMSWFLFNNSPVQLEKM